MKSSTENETIRQRMLDSALCDLMSRNEGSDWDDIDPELIVMLAQGRASEIDPVERSNLLKRIAGDPALGFALKSVREDMSDVAGIPMVGRTRLFLRMACAACILGMVLVGTSLIVDNRVEDRSVEVLDSGFNKNGFFDQLGSADPSTLARLAGDPVFVGLFILAVVLGCGSFWPRKSSRI